MIFIPALLACWKANNVTVKKRLFSLPIPVITVELASVSIHKDESSILNHLSELGESAQVIGEVVDSNSAEQRVVIN